MASLLACESDPSTPADASAAADAPAADAVADVAADAPATRHQYTPEGCGYMVWTPDSLTDYALGDTSTFGADPAPRDVHVTWPSSPDRAAAVLWRTDAGTRASVMQYGTSRDALGRTATGHAMTSRTTFGELTEHEVHVCGLEPDTTYYYRVGGEGHWSEVQRFKTAPAPGQSSYDVNFAVSGDSRDDFRVWRMIQERMLSVAGMHQPDFEVFTGDAVPLGPLQTAWNDWFAGAAPTASLMPFAVAHGNHEALSVNYLMQFAEPQEGRVDQDELYFSFDYGPIHFVFINDTPYAADYAGGFMGTQLAWLRRDLTDHRARRQRVPWLVAVHHKSPFSSSTHADDSDVQTVRRVLPPVFDEFDVDLALNGHDHDFEVSKSLDGHGDEAAAGHHGTVYMIAGGAGASLYRAGSRPWSRYSESTTNFMLVHATMRSLEVTPYRGDGTVITQGRVTLQAPMP